MIIFCFYFWSLIKQRFNGKAKNHEESERYYRKVLENKSQVLIQNKLRLDQVKIVLQIKIQWKLSINDFEPKTYWKYVKIVGYIKIIWKIEWVIEKLVQ